ncbi:hypothetical protein MM300_16230 [Evansella sp. LMS18]|jgi:DNA-binding MltR family transcriptional regulator|uniref:MltR family transcriptional regulator n=1 Tax=Evansella sp. LMS18 TaxID=2924033 RepID=UPI0020D115A4|nr:MltR family transcriptional regulator [Evansella sp. LMS18]UTR09432.1 hypothetical protein MM300_16230 [Evansella sp. LMS18]
MSNVDKTEIHNKMVNLFNDSEDRAAAIVAASYLEEQLKLVILGHFKNVTSLSANDKNNLTSGNGPLSTFSSRISIAYLLELINKEQYDDLNLIRKIRNDFAHQLNAVTFDSVDQIKNRCSSLKIYNENDAKTPRDRFFWSVTYISLHLHNFKKWEPKEMED